MARKTGNKWSTNKCGRCGEPHKGYSGKLNSKGIEYVVCEFTGKPMDVDVGDGKDHRVAHIVFSTHWIKND